MILKTVCLGWAASQPSLILQQIYSEHRSGVSGINNCAADAKQSTNQQAESSVSNSNAEAYWADYGAHLLSRARLSAH